MPPQPSPASSAMRPVEGSTGRYVPPRSMPPRQLGVEANPTYYDHDHESFRDRKSMQSVFSEPAVVSGRRSYTPSPAQWPSSPVSRRLDGSPGIEELTTMLQQAINVPMADAFMCAKVLSADGARSMNDVFMLVHAGALSPEIPVVMRLKIEYAAESAAAAVA